MASLEHERNRLKAESIELREDLLRSRTELVNLRHFGGLSIEQAAATPYENDHFQPLYFVSDSVEESCETMPTSLKKSNAVAVSAPLMGVVRLR